MSRQNTGMDRQPNRPRGPYAKTPERRREILRTALEVFGQYGYRGSSIREIAARVGMTDTGVVHHFGGKRNLLLEVLKERDEVDTALSTVDEPVDPFDRHIVARNTKRQGVVRMFATLSAEATDPDHPANKYFILRYAGLRVIIRQRFERQRALGRLSSDHDPELAARVTLAVMDGLQIQWLLDPTQDMSEAYDNFVNHYFGDSTRMGGLAGSKEDGCC